MLPSIEDINFYKLSYDNTCTYLDSKHIHGADTKKHMLDLMTFCKKDRAICSLLQKIDKIK